MKRWIFPCLALLFATLHAQTTYEVLFLGNSYTGVNDLPGILQSLTIAGGDSLIKDAHAPGGYTFEGHSTNSTSLAMIRARAWDFVVLQEQSQRPSFPQSQVQQDVYPYATQLNDSIQANDSCTVTVFYMTWGRKYGDASNCGFWPPVCTYAGMQYELRRSYLNMATQNNALVAPCGVAWWESILRDSTLELYNPDESHPSYAGSYLTACVFYATLYRQSPMGLGFYGGLDTTTAAFLQQVAHDVVFDSLTQWRIGLDDAVADFTYTTSTNGETNFTNTSSNANAWQWDFGDGGIDSVANPLHTYTATGLYVVTLIARDGCTSDTLVDTINVISVGRPDHPETQPFSIYPHPSAGIVHVSGNLDHHRAVTLRVNDANGKTVHERVALPQNGRLEEKLDLSVLPRGLYVLMVEGTEGRLATFKLVLE